MILKKISSLLFLGGTLFTLTVNASPINSVATVQQWGRSVPAPAGLNPKALQLGLEAYKKAREEGLDKQQILTIVDYTQPSTARRLWVLDLKSHSVLFHDYVAHGKNSGLDYANNFSDSAGSLKSSLGVFLTDRTYQGRHGFSLKLRGLDKGFNDNAASRDIVVHKADYATAQFVQQHGRLGRSWGCFAVSPRIGDSLIRTIKDGTLLFAYYPNSSWLENSRFLS